MTGLRLTLRETAELFRRFNDSFTPPLLDGDGAGDYIAKLSEFAFFLKEGQDEGFAAYYLNDGLKQLYITLIGVHKTALRKGVGRRMMEQLAEVARNHGYTSIGLEVDKGNANALKFYLSQGFEKETDRGHKYLMIRTL